MGGPDRLPLVPVMAALVHQRSGSYLSLPWMRRLAILVCLQLAVNWAMLGLAMNRVHNAWLADLAHLPEVLLPLWVLAGLGPRIVPRAAFITAAAAMVSTAAWNAAHVGLGAKWPVAEATASILLLALCVWQFKGLLAQEDQRSAWNQPASWLLGAWTLDQAIMLMLYPLQNLFLHQLSRDWILVPWLVRFIIGLFLNLAIAKTFLCRTTNSY